MVHNVYEFASIFATIIIIIIINIVNLPIRTIWYWTDGN